MTAIGSACLVLVSLLISGWILDLIRRGRLYVGYGIVVLVGLGLVVAVSILPATQYIWTAVTAALFPREPVAVLGIGVLLLLLVYVLHQLSVLSDRVATLTQELALRSRSETNKKKPGK